MPQTDPSADAVVAAVDRIVASQAFQGAGRSGSLLRFLVDETLNGRADQLKEYTLGAEALGRGAAFDPRTDSIARVEASRLRQRLEHYYATEGRAEPLRIGLPRGSYVPRFEVGAGPTSEPASPRRPWRLAVPAALALGAVVLWAAWRPAPGAALPTLRFDVDLGESAALRSSHVGSSSVILAPDGSRLVFVSFRRQTPHLMVMRLDRVAGAQPIALAGTDGARGPFFSPDGKWVAYWAGARLWKVPVDGGTPVTLCDAPDLLGGSWGDDGTIVAALGTSGLWRVPSTGGTPVRIEGIPEGARFPHVLPGAAGVLFGAGAPAAGPPRVAVFSFRDRRLRDLAVGGGHPRYLASGHLAYVDRGRLFVAAFDLSRQDLSGTPSVLLEDVAVTAYGAAEFDVSRTGTLVYRRRPASSTVVVNRLDPSGAVTPIVDEPGEYGWPRLSPDGTRLSLLVGTMEQRAAMELRVVDVRNRAVVRSSLGVAYSSPVWSPDGRFLVSPRPSGGIDWLPVGRADPPRPLQTSTALQIPWSFAAAGGRLAYYERGLRPGAPVTFDLWTVPVRRDGAALAAGTPEPFLVSDAFEVYPSFSPDGRWIAYASLASGAYEIYVRTFPDTGREWRISTDGGVAAGWSRDGRRIYYVSSDRRVMVADWHDGVQERVGPPRPWSDHRLADTGVSPSFDVGPDGAIVALMPSTSPGPSPDGRHVTFVVNALAEVGRLASGR